MTDGKLFALPSRTLEGRVAGTVESTLKKALVRSDDAGLRSYHVGNTVLRVLRLLGNSRTNHTFLVEGPEGKEVLKVLNYRLAPGEEARERMKSMELFEREFAVLSRLEHPQIPQALSRFITEADGETAFHFTQKYFEGPTIEQILQKRGKLPPQEAAAIILSVLNPLEYCHQQDPPVIHRDIKPANLIWDGTEARLVDFGMVLDKPSPTIGGSTIGGTPGYLAPEQWIGQTTPRSDIYGVGATLLEMVTGKKAESMYQQDAGTFEEKFRIRYKEHTTSLDEHLQQIFGHCLELDPQKRYPAVAELRQELQQYLEKPVVVRRKEERPAPSLLPAFIDVVKTGVVMGGIILGVGMGISWCSQHAHNLNSNEMAVLVDSRGNVMRDEHGGYSGTSERRRDEIHLENIHEYIEENKISAHTTVYFQGKSMGYPIQGYLEYQIKDPVQIHLLTRVAPQPQKGKELKESEKGEGEERLKAMLEESMREYMKDIFFEERQRAQKREKTEISDSILALFRQNYPKGIEFKSFDYRLGAPGM